MELDRNDRIDLIHAIMDSISRTGTDMNTLSYQRGRLYIDGDFDADALACDIIEYLQDYVN